MRLPAVLYGRGHKECVLALDFQLNAPHRSTLQWLQASSPGRFMPPQPTIQGTMQRGAKQRYHFGTDICSS
jgi:hypothetical protein